jgi:acyl carrier protein
VFEILKNILVDKLKVAPEQVTMEANKDDLELDSLGVVELSMILQSELGLEITDNELLEVETIAEMVALMEERRVASR